MNNRIARTLLVTTLVAISFATVHGQELNPALKIVVGKPFAVNVATPATGQWAKENPFDPTTYGKVRGYCPISSRDPKIVLCTLSLDNNFLRLAVAVDSFLARHGGLEKSVIQVADSKGAQWGGYTKEEVQQRIEELRKVAQENKIEHQSFTLSATDASGFSWRLGFKENNNNLLIAHLAASDDPKQRPVVKWVERRNTANLSDAAIQEIIASLEKSVENKK